jgi:hypothetical protein
MAGIAGKAGRKTDLTKELFAKIKNSILEGNNLKETARICDIEENTLYRWNCDNYASLSNKVEGWKRDRKLLLAEKKIEQILELSISDKATLKIQAYIAKFTAETLGKDNYSKRTENTGKDGKDLPQPILFAVEDKTNVQNNNSDNQDNETRKEDQGSVGGDIS